MGRVIIISGPVGAGKSTVAKCLVDLFKSPCALIEGDKFWSFIPSKDPHTRRQQFVLIMRSMIAAAIPFAKSDYDVIVDFSIPPEFLPHAEKILKGIPCRYVVICPSLAVCQTRAKNRTEGQITDYSEYSNFYDLFSNQHELVLRNDSATPEQIAEQVFAQLF